MKKDPARRKRYIDYGEVERVRALKRDNKIQYCIDRRVRRRLKKRWIGYTRETREYLSEAMDMTCVYCGDKPTTVDHVIPKSKGGTNHWHNLVPACATCNNRKGAKPLKKFLEELCHEKMKG